MKVTRSTIKANVAREQGLYAVGQNLLADVFSGSAEGFGSVAAEMEAEQRENEPLLMFTAKKIELVDAFDHPHWNWIRTQTSEKARHIREQGFSEQAILPYSNLETGGINVRPDASGSKFVVRNPEE